MLLAKATGYGVRALAYLAQHRGRLCSLQEVASAEQIPPVFLRKVLGELRRHKLLRSITGIHGGYALTRDPASVTVWDVIQLIDPNPDIDACILACNEDAAECGLHPAWSRLRQDMIGVFRSTTILDLAEARKQTPDTHVIGEFG